MSLDPKSTYYDAGGIETIKIIEAKLSPEFSPLANVALANILKYACRVFHKGQEVRDAQKLEIYAGQLADELSKRELEANERSAKKREKEEEDRTLSEIKEYNRAIQAQGPFHI